MKGERYYTYYNDKDILQGIISGDAKALEAAIDRYQPQMMIEAFYLLKDVQESEDAIQEIFIRIWQNRHKFDEKKFSSIGPYLLRATRNECLVRIGKTKVALKRRDLFTHNLSPSVSYDPLEAKELKSIIESAIASLPPKAQNSFKKLYEEGFSQKEISQQENVALQTVKNNIVRGLKVLREKLHSLR
jgi:RNA polymerase sigma-70 factor (ECF subfamily)